MRHLRTEQHIPADLMARCLSQPGIKSCTIERMWADFGHACGELFAPNEQRHADGSLTLSASLYVCTPEQYIQLKDDIQKAAYRAGYAAGKADSDKKIVTYIQSKQQAQVAALLQAVK